MRVTRQDSLSSVEMTEMPPPSYEGAEGPSRSRTQGAESSQLPPYTSRAPSPNPQPVAPAHPRPSLVSRAYTSTLSGVSSALSKKPVRFGAGAVVGAGITAGTTYAVVRFVQHLIATARVDPNPQTWIDQARSRAYDPCYNGCNDCNDVNFAFNACAVTEKLNVTGVLCDGNAMWNWADRYPLPCLQALGVIYKQQALDALKQSDRNHLALIILTVLAGVVGAGVTYGVLGCVANRAETAAQARRQNNGGNAP